jgi:hypothetical protein
MIAGPSVALRAALMVARSWIKARMGAVPVPAQIIMTGPVESRGR